MINVNYICEKTNYGSWKIKRYLFKNNKLEEIFHVNTYANRKDAEDYLLLAKDTYENTYCKKVKYTKCENKTFLEITE